ncbi:MAG: glycosyl hydrolase family 18 protein [Anaerolineae bacterium]|nr:glycosyl hydrolase family 18 protein [Candidatus Roseilinea sp.]MDW8449949.1 glycosyl hydrolase family 18 protein [Anaerolineae bacterium]
MAVGAALVGLSLISANSCSEFTTERTTVAVEGFQIRVMPSDLAGSFGVKLGVLSLADFTPASRNAELQAAAASLPAGLTLVSDPVAVKTCSVDPKLATLRMSIPPGVEAGASLDLYGWDDKAREWTWLGGEVDAASREVVARVSRVPSLVALMKVAPIPPSLSVESPPVTGDPAAIVKSIPSRAYAVHATGLYLGDAGSIVGDPGKLLRPAGAPIKTIPVVRNWGAKGEVNRTLLRTMLASEASRAAHVDALLGLVVAGGFEGVQIDYRGVEEAQRDAFAQFVELLSARLAERGKTLSVAVPAPSLTGATGDAAGAAGVFDSPGYDLHRIGRAAASVQLDLSTNPEAWCTSQLDPLIEWVVGRVNRHKLQVIVPTLSVQKDANGRVRLIGLEESLAALGGLQTVAPAVAPGANVRLWWSGNVEPSDVRYDATGQFYSYSYVDERGIQQTVWLNTAASLKRTLERLSRHNIRGVTLRGLAHPGSDEGVMQVVDGFARGDLASVQAPEPVIKVAFGAGTPFSLPLGQSPDAMIVQAPGGEGEYEIVSVFQSARTVTLDPSRVAVSKDAPTAEGGANTMAVASVAADQTAPGVAPTLPGVNAEQFELGGHVNDLVHAAQMKTAGMTWARTEVRGEVLPEAFIAEAKAKGLKVLVTAVGDRSRIMDIAYRDQWAQHLGKIAAAGADAIEVWSEPNYQAEWPAGQINGASYADLLKRAYFAIKQANPNTLVISAGLAQTSGVYSGGCAEDGCDELAFLSQMAAERAQDYMDCVGIHYTSGFEPPSAVGALHYSQYYEPLRNAYYGAFNGAKPVCFTALGYVTAEGFPSGMPAKYAFAAGTTLANHVAWLAEAARLSKASGKVRLMIVWNVDATTWTMDDPSRNVEGDPQAGYAMIRPDGTCPACESLRSVMK